MKRKYVFTNRVIRLTAVAAILAAVVQITAFVSMNNSRAVARTRDEVCAQCALLVQGANEPLQYTGSASMLNAMGGIVWLYDSTGFRSVTDNSAKLSAALTDEMASLQASEQLVHRLKLNGRTHMLCAAPVVSASGKRTAVFAVAMPLDYTEAWLCIVLSLLLGFLVAGGVLYVGIRWFILPTDKALVAVHKVAIDISQGNLSKKAPEDGPGLIGSVGVAINNISAQLSQSMYKLIVERNRLKSMLNGLSEGIVAVDLHGQITHTNPALNRIYRIRHSSLVRLPDARLRLIPNQEVWNDFDHVIKSGESITRNYEVRDMTVRLVISPIRDDLDKIAGAIGLFTDITEMERLDRTRREYVSNVSHELRTPMTAIRALVEPLKEGMVTKEEDRQRYYSIILNEVMRLSRLINDQLELSRLQSGTVSIEKKSLKLDDLIYDICDRYSIIAEEKGLALKMDTDFSKCPTIYGNEDRVEQLLIILLDNALKYTEQGHVAVSGTWDSEKVTLTISDTGVGIDEKDLEYVFDRFYKVDKAHSGKGSGLGLSIANEVVTRMNERIWVESELGKGTAFSFTIHLKDKAKP